MGLPPFFCHNAVGDPLATPPPAHCGIPPYQLDPKTMGKWSEQRIYLHFRNVQLCIWSQQMFCLFFLFLLCIACVTVWWHKWVVVPAIVVYTIHRHTVHVHTLIRYVFIHLVEFSIDINYSIYSTALQFHVTTWKWIAQMHTIYVLQSILSFAQKRMEEELQMYK